MPAWKRLRAAQALSSGLVHALAKTADDMLAQARAWIAQNSKPQQPWDAPKFRYPGGDSRSPAIAQLMAVAPSMASAKSWGNYPAITHIMSSVFEGGLVDFDTALQIESRYFAACVVSPESRNLIGTLWYQLNAIKKGASRPQGVPVSKVKKLGILGAGMMGAGIAYVAAKAGLEVVLLDTTQALADKGKAYSQGLLDKAVKRGYRSAEQRDAHLARIQADGRDAERLQLLQRCEARPAEANHADVGPHRTRQFRQRAPVAVVPDRGVHAAIVAQARPEASSPRLTAAKAPSLMTPTVA